MLCLSQLWNHQRLLVETQYCPGHQQGRFAQGSE